MKTILQVIGIALVIAVMGGITWMNCGSCAWDNINWNDLSDYASRLLEGVNK